LLKARSPGIDFVPVDDTRAALEAVADGRADAAVDILPVLHQQIEGFPPGKVKLVGVTDVQFPLRIMVGRQHAALIPLINRAIAAITPEERAAIHNKWLLRQVVTAPDYTLLWQVLVMALLILATILVWNQRLHREVARRKQAETELLHAKDSADRASRAKGDFLANMSHEIRTPLNAVIGLTRLALETGPAPALCEYLGKIDVSARTLLALINDVLDLSRIEAGKLHPRQEPLQLTEVLDRVRVGFAVSDTGIGIHEERCADLFDVFTQVDSSSTRSHGGSGLGLAISARLVALMGGRLEMESAEGVGSRFWFSLAFPRATEEAKEVAVSAPSLEALRGARVLVAEDDTTNQLLVRDLLSRRGVEVTLAANGAEVVAAAAQGRFDLVLMDIRMPEMDGLEACRRIRALPGGDLPIVALTANALAEERERCLAAGMDGYLTKPLEPEALYAELCRWLRLAEELAEAAGRLELALENAGPVDAGLRADFLASAEAAVAVLAGLEIPAVEDASEEDIAPGCEEQRQRMRELEALVEAGNTRALDHLPWLEGWVDAKAPREGRELLRQIEALDFPAALDTLRGLGGGVVARPR
jgi:signal transduction histidine kinase/DNA-binding NarL/FixJ family response regulator